MQKRLRKDLKKLTLHRETLRRLDPVALEQVGGGIFSLGCHPNTYTTCATRLCHPPTNTC